uniref:Cytochrome c oxidase assembly protein COX11, mitochondrial n=1 Tax=Setaria digitata TaxID=48799 RepID=A0A915Q009_9BILA
MLTLIRAFGCAKSNRGLLIVLCNRLTLKQPCRTFTNWARRYVKSKNAMYYLGSVGVFFFSLAVLSIADDMERIASMEKIKSRLIRVSFNADLHSAMKWQFKPLQKEIYVHPGETALVFYSAYNPTDKPIAAYYFNKIQCFCFEDQILNPGEQVDLPVFFYIDPDYVNDPDLEYTDSLILSYTFFESKSDLVLPDPFDPNNQPSIKRNASSIEKELEKKLDNKNEKNV